MAINSDSYSNELPSDDLADLEEVNQSFLPTESDGLNDLYPMP
jgi:hypothetical protein